MMERLTEHHVDGKGAYMKCSEHCEEDGCGDCGNLDHIIDRLAAYEDTGLTPEEVKLIANVLREVGETYNCWFNYVAQCVIENSKLQKLAQAERAGLLVVLPAGVTRESLSGELASLVDMAFGDGKETYTTGYRNGHKNGVIETLRRVLGIPDGTCQDAETALDQAMKGRE